MGRVPKHEPILKQKDYPKSLESKIAWRKLLGANCLAQIAWRKLLGANWLGANGGML